MGLWVLLHPFLPWTQCNLFSTTDRKLCISAANTPKFYLPLCSEICHCELFPPNCVCSFVTCSLPHSSSTSRKWKLSQNTNLQAKMTYIFWQAITYNLTVPWVEILSYHVKSKTFLVQYIKGCRLWKVTVYNVTNFFLKRIVPSGFGWFHTDHCVDEPLVSQQWRGRTCGYLTSQTLTVLHAFTSQESRMSLFDEWHCSGSIISSGPAAKEVSQPLEGRANNRPQLLSHGRLTL